MLWLAILALPLLCYLALGMAGRGWLIRSDPMSVSDTDPPFVDNVACSYLWGFHVVTVLSLGNKTDAVCPRLYKVGALPRCPDPLNWHVTCEEND